MRSDIDKAVRNSKEVKAAPKLKHNLFARAGASPKTPHLASETNSASKQVKLCVRSVLAYLEASLARKCKDNPRLLFSYINGQTKRKNNISALIDRHGNSVTSKDTIVLSSSRSIRLLIHQGRSHQTYATVRTKNNSSL